MPQVKTAADEFMRQVLQQGGIARRISRPDIIEGLDQTRSCQISPKAIGIAGSEKPVLRRGNPGSQLSATRGRRGGRRTAAGRNGQAAFRSSGGSRLGRLL